MKKLFGLTAIVGALLAGAVIFGMTNLRSEVRAGTQADFALAEFRVEKLTCGSCVRNIQKALSDIDGVGDVNVSVTNGRARVEFLPEKVDVISVASIMTAAGYPSTVSQMLSPGEYRSLREDESRLATRFVGRIGERLISREKFGDTVADLENRSAVKDGNILKTAWNDILQRELLLDAANKNGVIVQDSEVDLEMERLVARENFSKAQIENRYGSPENFRRWLREQMVIEQNIELHVVNGEKDSLRRRALLNDWYGKLVKQTPVVIFDPALKSIVAGSGKGCGGSCCG